MIIHKILQTLLAVVLSITAQAQAPQGIPYQAAARNANGNIMANQAINVRFTIHDSTANGTYVYQETHSATTNAQGMFSLNMGLGTPTTGSFNQINWGNNAKFMQVELSTNGGSNYTDMGTQQMMSVPYALYAKNGVPKGNNVGDMLYWDGNNWEKVAAGQPGQIMIMGNNAPQWTSLISTNSILSIGMNFQGGIIAYILQPGDIGFDPTTPHGIIVSQTNINVPNAPSWGCQGSYINTSTSIGTGQANTQLIVNSCNQNNIAAKLCDDLVLNGFSDWYLPSKDEMNKIIANANQYQFASQTGLNTNSLCYWTSSQSDANNAWSYCQSSGMVQFGKNVGFAARAVRSF